MRNTYKERKNKKMKTVYKRKNGRKKEGCIPLGPCGITLVALVITIIILLILAGITLTLVLGENGIITKAQEAKQKTEQARIEEQVSLAYLEAKAMEGQYVESKGVNSPVLGEAMVPVDGEGNPITSYEEWFDYKDQGPVGTAMSLS